MKRLSLAIIFACCTLAVAAQEGIQVKYQGAKPTINLIFCTASSTFLIFAIFI